MMGGGGSGKNSVTGGGDAGNNAIAAIAKKAAVCGALQGSATCSGNKDCEWKASDNKCEISGNVAMQLMMGGGASGNNAMTALFSKSQACAVLTSSTCSG